VRREHSAERAHTRLVEWDEHNGLYKLCPLLDWTGVEIWQYIHANSLPYNALHLRGYPSIGCAPCTRPTRSGDDLRAGRWWWERPESRECGLLPRNRASSVPVIATCD